MANLVHEHRMGALMVIIYERVFLILLLLEHIYNPNNAFICFVAFNINSDLMFLFHLKGC